MKTEYKKILITGIACTGKTAFRLELIAYLNSFLPNVISWATNWGAIKTDWINYKKTIWVVEDTLEANDNSHILIGNYDFVFYLFPKFKDHLELIKTNSIITYDTGYLNWNVEKNGWNGSGKPKDLKNLPRVLFNICHALRQRKNIKHDINLLKRLKIHHQIIRPRIINRLAIDGKIKQKYLTFFI